MTPKQILNHTLCKDQMYYSFTLFTNYFQLEEDHDQKLFQLLESQGLAPYSLVTSPLSSFSYVYAKSEHQDCFGSLNRPSARRHHVGTNKTTIQILKNMQIINFQDLVSRAVLYVKRLWRLL